MTDGVANTPSVPKPGSDRARRRFGLLDALLLVIPAGLAFFAIRLRRDNVLYPGFSDWERSTLPFSFVMFFTECLGATAWLLAVYSPTLLLLRFRKPRPRLRRIALQPGSAALIVATLAAVIGLLSTLLSQTIIALWGDPTPPMRTALDRPPHPIFVAVDRHVVGFLPWFIGFGVVAVWLILVVSRRARPERSWLDRAGRMVGVIWVLLVLNYWVHEHWPYDGSPLRIETLLDPGQ